MRKQKKLGYRKRVVWSVFPVVFFLACTTDYNPFQYHNANAYVLDWPFQKDELVEMYHTDTLFILPTVSEKIDSICVVAPKNRYWEDTIYVPLHNQRVDTLILPVSFTGKGTIDITVTTYRSNGDFVIQSSSYQVVSPLRPQNVIGQFGLATLLYTDPVYDPDVLYHWDLGSGRKVESVKNRDSVQIFIGATSGTGYLWVSDLSEQNSSPLDSFSYTFNDTVPPVIECLNDSLRGDTIISGDSLLVFKALIYDKNQGKLAMTSVNGQAFDSENPRQNLFLKRISSIRRNTAANPFELVVEAKDDPLFNNSRTRTFFAVYDSTLPQNLGTDIEFIYPSQDASTSANQRVQVIVNAIHNTGSEVRLSLMVNDQMQEQTTVIPGNAAQWEQVSWHIDLTQAVSVVSVTATDVQSGRVTGRVSREIRYDASIPDNRKPMIWEISSDNIPVNGMVVDSPTITMRILAFDEGSGIQTMEINGKVHQPLENEPYIWEFETALAHATAGNSFEITVSDRSGNVSDTTVTVFYNNRPYFNTAPVFPEVFYVDSTYFIPFRITDPDDDQVRVYPTDGGPLDTSDVTNSSILWTPSVDDVGTDTVQLVLDDGYADKTIFNRIISVTNSANLIARPRFTVGSDDIPEVLQAGVDSLEMQLGIEQGTGEPPLRWSCTIGNNALLYDSTSNRVSWKPDSEEIGRHRMTAIVSDLYNRTDTLIEYIEVVPRNQYPVQLTVDHDLPTTRDGALDMSRLTSPQALIFTIHDQDHHLTEEYSLQISRGGITSFDTLDSPRSIQIEIEPSDTREPDTLFVKVTDKTFLSTGIYDSVTIPLAYAPPIQDIADIPDLTASMDAGSGVNAPFGAVSSWESTTGSFTLTAVGNGLRRHTIFGTSNFPVLEFSESVSTHLYNDSGWEGSPFTIVTVVRFTSVDAERQVIVSSGDNNSFELGITCDGNIGIFNERSQSECWGDATVQSDLSVDIDRWYIISYRSETGIQSGYIEVNVRRNGTAASQTLIMDNASSGPYFSVGAGEVGSSNGHLNAYMAQLLFFDRAVTSDEQVAVERLLAEKFSIELE